MPRYNMPNLRALSKQKEISEDKDKLHVRRDTLEPPALCNTIYENMGPEPFCAPKTVVSSPPFPCKEIQTELIRKFTVHQKSNECTQYSREETKTKIKSKPEGKVTNASCDIGKMQSSSPPIKPNKDKNPQDQCLDENYLLEWWGRVHSWHYLSKDQTLNGKAEEKIFTVKADRIHNAIQLHKLLLTKHGETLSNHIEELRSVADNLDKVSKGTKIAGITGGAAGAVGGAAAVAGVILAPFTCGASLAITAVGVGMAAAGGVTGATAAIANKVNLTQDSKRIENNLIEYSKLMESANAVLKFINEGWEQLRQHDMSFLRGIRVKAMRVAEILEAAGGEASSSALEASSKASGLMEGFALDMYYTTGKKGPKLKKGLVSQLAMKIREVIEQMKLGLDEHMRVKKLFCDGE